MFLDSFAWHPYLFFVGCFFFSQGSFVSECRLPKQESEIPVQWKVTVLNLRSADILRQKKSGNYMKVVS